MVAGMNRRSDRDDSSDEDNLLKFLDEASKTERWCYDRRERRARKKRKILLQDHTPAIQDKFVKPVSVQDKDLCMGKLREALGAEGLDESVCSVCDRLVLSRDLIRVEGSDWITINKLRRVLGTADETIPYQLVKQYRAPPQMGGLEDVLISPQGIHCYVTCDGYPTAWMGVCGACMRSINFEVLPKFAIANGFFVGQLPKHLQGLTIPERFMTQPTSIAAITRVMRGGRHRCIRSHCLAFDCTPGPPISLLPRSIDDSTSYRVVLVGDFTEEQTSKVTRSQRVKSVFNFYKTYNHLYESVTPNVDVLDAEYADQVFHDLVAEHVEDSSEVLSESIATELESLRVVFTTFLS